MLLIVMVVDSRARVQEVKGEEIRRVGSLSMHVGSSKIIGIMQQQQGNRVITDVYACYMYGVWSMGHGAWSTEHGAWSMEHGAKACEFCCPCCFFVPLPTWAEMLVQGTTHGVRSSTVRTGLVMYVCTYVRSMYVPQTIQNPPGSADMLLCSALPVMNPQHGPLAGRVGTKSVFGAAFPLRSSPLCGNAGVYSIT